MNDWRRPALLGISAAIHLGALVALLWRPQHWPLWLAIALADHLLVVAIGLWPRSVWLGPNWLRLPAAAAASGMVAITIDDGPDPEVTPQVLDLLDRHGAAATFFCIGERALRHPELCREIERRGHAVENHSLRHRHDFSLRGPAALRREIEASQHALQAITGSAPRFFRAPAGLRNLFLAPVLRRAGLQLTAWTRRGFDTRERDPQRVLQRLTRDLAAGDILLLHDGHAARTADGTPLIVAVLPQLLAALRERGLRPVTLRTALPTAEATPRVC